MLPTMGEGREVLAMSPSASSETAMEKSISNDSGGNFSRSMCNDNKELMDPFAAKGEDDDKEGGKHSKDKGEYAEEETPHIRVIQSAMQDQGLNAVEQNKKISFAHCYAL